MKENKKSKKNVLSKAESVLDLATGTLGALPNITLYGTAALEIDNFKSLMDFSPDTVRVNTTDGIVRIDGINLRLAFMSDESISVRGDIRNLSFE